MSLSARVSSGKRPSAALGRALPNTPAISQRSPQAGGRPSGAWQKEWPTRSILRRRERGTSSRKMPPSKTECTGGAAQWEDSQGRTVSSPFLMAITTPPRMIVISTAVVSRKTEFVAHRKPPRGKPESAQIAYAQGSPMFLALRAEFPQLRAPGKTPRFQMLLDTVSECISANTAAISSPNCSR